MVTWKCIKVFIIRSRCFHICHILIPYDGDRSSQPAVELRKASLRSIVLQALWLTYLGERNSHNNKDVEYHLGLATPMLLPVLGQIQEGVMPQLRILNVETSTTTMSQGKSTYIPITSKLPD